MEVDAHRIEMVGVVGTDIHPLRRFDIDTELVLVQTGGDIGVGFGIDVGIDTDTDARLDPQLFRDRLHPLHLRFALEIEQENVLLQRLLDLVVPFADTAENDLVLRYTGTQRPLDLSDRDTVGSRSKIGQMGDDGEVGVGLHGVADDRLSSGKSLFQLLVLSGNVIEIVNV